MRESNPAGTGWLVRSRLLSLLLCLVSATFPAAVAAAEPGLLLTFEPNEVVVGDPVTVRVSIQGLSNQGLPSGSAELVSLAGAASLGLPPTVSVGATGEIRVEITPREPGAFVVEASAEGFAAAADQLVVLQGRMRVSSSSIRRPLSENVAPRADRVSAAPSAPAPARRREITTELPVGAVEKVLGSLADRGPAAGAAPRWEALGFDAEMLAFRDELVEASSGDIPITLRFEAAGVAQVPQSYELRGLEGRKASVVLAVDVPVGTGRSGGRSFEAGTVVLTSIPVRGEVAPADGQWRPFEIEARWEVDGQPQRRASPLQLAFRVVDSGAVPPDVRPALAEIPANRSSLLEPIRLSKRGDLGAEEIVVRASWQEVSSAELPLLFLERKATGLAFLDPETVVEALGRTKRTVSVAVVHTEADVGDQNRWLPLGVDGRACLQGRGPGDDVGPICQEVEADDERIDFKLTLAQEGTYVLSATAGPLGSFADARIEYRLAWFLLVVALVAGVAGAAVARLMAKKGRWDLSLVLGGVAGLVAVVLFHFLLLDLLLPIIPGADRIQDQVPRGSQLGTALVAFLAGLAGKLVLGRFTGGAQEEGAGPVAPPAS